jgi:putative protease
VSTGVRSRSLELLAPAGGPDALKAAVRNGADAVYLGTHELNARRGAENFTLAGLAEACRYAHLRGSKVYLAANVLVLEDEMRDALDMIARAWEAGVDAVIVQDLGLIRCVRAALPEVRLHGSTQIDAHNSASIRVLEHLGVSRVTLARELSVAEISGLVAASGVELECFVHGSLCFCHSGQCLFSSLAGGRSANRGQCAQPCRLPYDLLGDDGSPADAPGRYLLSPRDLCGIAQLPALAASGVTALKIEGRMKSPEYVASVVSVYRAAIDRVLSDPLDFSVRDAETDALEEAFNRGFTMGYLEDVRDDRLMSYMRPNNRGVPLGRVVETRPGHAVVALERSLESADTLEFWTSAGRFAQPAGRLALADGSASAAPSGVKVSIAVEKPVRAGDRVFRVMNAALMEAARRSWQGAEEKRAVPLRVLVRVRVGEPLSLTLEVAGVSVTETGAVVESARTRPVTADEVAEHVGRLGGTPYAATDVTVQVDVHAGIGFSELHRVRRDAIERLDGLRLAAWAERVVPLSPQPLALPVGAGDRSAAVVALELVVTVANEESARACLEAGADRVLMTIAQTGMQDARIHASLPRVVHEREVPGVLEDARAFPPPHVAGNLGVLSEIVERGESVEADWGLNAANPWTVSVLAELGASAVWVSPELSSQQVASLVASSAVPIGVLGGGHVELMVAEHCVLQSAGPCSHACASCARRLRSWTLRDRKGYLMPVTTDAAGRAHIYNAVPLDLSRSIAELLDAGVASVRLEMQTEGAEEAARITAEWRDRLRRAAVGKQLPYTPIAEPSTTGHFYRGVS